jgi:SAM-dependent methyltransferase
MSGTSNFEPLRRSDWNWRRKRDCILPTDIPPPFFYARDIETVSEYFSACADEPVELAKSHPGLKGRCFICKEEVVFSIDVPADGSPVNWRETLVCPRCNLINRWRSCLHVFEAICKPTLDDRIYLTETLSPIYQNLAGRFPLISASEYFPEHEFGEMVQTHTMPVRNEDVTNLRFGDASRDIILCFDVLEHVPDYRAALREFHRVLASGGQLVLSVPFSFQTGTIVRATVDENGNIKHLLEPLYHGDPLSEQGVLSYYDFGMALLDDMRMAGFEDCFSLCYQSKEWGYLDRNIVFIARKLKPSVTKAGFARLAWRHTRYRARLGAEKIAERARLAAQYPVTFARRVLNRLFARPGRKIRYGENLGAVDDALRKLKQVSCAGNEPVWVQQPRGFLFSTRKTIFEDTATRQDQHPEYWLKGL